MISRTSIRPDCAADAGGRHRRGVVLPAARSSTGAGRVEFDSGSRRRADSPATPTPTTPTTADADIKDLELDWSQLNVDASTLTTSSGSKARVAPQAGDSREHVVVVAGQAERLVRGVGEAAAVAILGHPGRRRHDRGPAAADADESRVAGGESSPMAAACRNPPARPGPRSPRPASARSGTRPRSRPGRSLAGAKQARHLPEQVAAAQRAIFAHAAERLQPDPAGHRAGARHHRPPDRATTRPSNRRS